MASGLGFTTFATGDVLTAASVNGYLMQGVWVFADSTARDAAVTSPQEGNMCYLKSTDAVQYYSGTAWTAVGGGGGGGKVLQVVNATTSTSAYTSGNTFIDTNLTATITPSASTSKVLVIFFQNGVAKNASNAGGAVGLQLLRGSTAIASPVGNYALWTNTTLTQNAGSIGTTYLDSPATTSATTYKTQIRSVLNVDGVYAQDNGAVSTMTLMEIGA